MSNTASRMTGALLLAVLTLAPAVATTSQGETDDEQAVEQPEEADDTEDEVAELDEADDSIDADAAVAAAEMGATDPWREARWQLDLNVDLGAAYHDSAVGFYGRGRGGLTRVTAQGWALTMGLAGDWIANAPATIGAEVEALSLQSAFFLRTGGGVDFDGRPLFNAGVGWQMLGVGIHVRQGAIEPDEYGVTALGYVRLPISWFAEAVAR